jgi:CheY-like chemotaxis protein
VDDGLQGKSICFVPPEEYSTATTEYKVQRLGAARASVESIAKSLGMNVVSFAKDGTPDDAPDFCFLDASILDDAKDVLETLPQWALLRRSKTRIVLLCYGLHDGGGLDVPAIRLRQPLGPKKLISGLRDAEPTVIEPSRTVDPLTTAQIASSQVVADTKAGLSEAAQQSTTTSSLSTTLTPSTSSSAQGQATSAKPKHHILIVDDNPINVKLLSTQMQRLGHSFYTAMNGLEAIQLFKASKERFDFVFMDISMPVMNGFEATQEIRGWEKAMASENRAEPAPAAATIIALTGLGSSLSKQEAFSSGVNVFLTKPVSLKEVKKILDGE